MPHTPNDNLNNQQNTSTPQPEMFDDIVIYDDSYYIEGRNSRSQLCWKIPENGSWLSTPQITLNECGDCEYVGFGSNGNEVDPDEGCRECGSLPELFNISIDWYNNIHNEPGTNIPQDYILAHCAGRGGLRLITYPGSFGNEAGIWVWCSGGINDLCDTDIVSGCMDPTATNYNPDANVQCYDGVDDSQSLPSNPLLPPSTVPDYSCCRFVVNPSVDPDDGSGEEEEGGNVEEDDDALLPFPSCFEEFDINQSGTITNLDAQQFINMGRGDIAERIGVLALITDDEELIAETGGMCPNGYEGIDYDIFQNLGDDIAGDVDDDPILDPSDYEFEEVIQGFYWTCPGDSYTNSCVFTNTTQGITQYKSQLECEQSTACHSENPDDGNFDGYPQETVQIVTDSIDLSELPLDEQYAINPEYLESIVENICQSYTNNMCIMTGNRQENHLLYDEEFYDANLILWPNQIIYEQVFFHAELDEDSGGDNQDGHYGATIGAEFTPYYSPNFQTNQPLYLSYQEDYTYNSWKDYAPIGQIIDETEWNIIKFGDPAEQNGQYLNNRMNVLNYEIIDVSPNTFRFTCKPKCEYEAGDEQGTTDTPSDNKNQGMTCKCDGNPLYGKHWSRYDTGYNYNYYAAGSIEITNSDIGNGVNISDFYSQQGMQFEVSIVDQVVVEDPEEDEEEQEEPIEEILGCTDPGADNYNQFANVDDGSCEYTDPSDEETILDTDFGIPTVDNIEQSVLNSYDPYSGIDLREENRKYCDYLEIMTLPGGNTNGDGVFYQTGPDSPQQSPYGFSTPTDNDIISDAEFVAQLDCDKDLTQSLYKFNILRAICKDGSYVEIANQSSTYTTLFPGSELSEVIEFPRITDLESAEISESPYDYPTEISHLNCNPNIYQNTLNTVTNCECPDNPDPGSQCNQNSSYCSEALQDLQFFGEDYGGSCPEECIETVDGLYSINYFDLILNDGTTMCSQGLYSINEPTLGLDQYCQEVFGSSAEADTWDFSDFNSNNDQPYSTAKYTVSSNQINEYEINDGESLYVINLRCRIGSENNSFKYINGEQACKLSTIDGSNLFFKTDIDERPSLGCFVYSDDLSADNFLLDLKEDEFQSIVKSNLLKNGDGRLILREKPYIRINQALEVKTDYNTDNYYDPITEYDDDIVDNPDGNKNIGLGNNTFKPQGDWTYINMGSVNYEINYHLNKVYNLPDENGYDTGVVATDTRVEGNPTLTREYRENWIQYWEEIGESPPAGKGTRFAGYYNYASSLDNVYFNPANGDGIWFGNPISNGLQYLLPDDINYSGEKWLNKETNHYQFNPYLLWYTMNGQFIGGNTWILPTDQQYSSEAFANILTNPMSYTLDSDNNPKPQFWPTNRLNEDGDYVNGYGELYGLDWQPYPFMFRHHRSIDSTDYGISPPSHGTYWWAKWVKDNECYSNNQCLQFAAPNNYRLNYPNFLDWNGNNQPESNGKVIDGQDYIEGNIYRTNNQTQELELENVQKLFEDLPNDGSIKPSIKISFWMKTKSTTKWGDYPFGESVTPPAEIEVGIQPFYYQDERDSFVDEDEDGLDDNTNDTGDSHRLSKMYHTHNHIGAPYMMHAGGDYPYPDSSVFGMRSPYWHGIGDPTDSNSDKWKLGTGYLETVQTANNSNFYYPYGYHNSLNEDSFLDSYDKEQHFDGVATFKNNVYDIWEKFSFQFHLSSNILESINSSKKGLSFFVQSANDFAGVVLLDNFEVTEGYQFTPDVDVRTKKSSNSYGKGSLLNYYDSKINPEEYNDNVAPLEASFYFYPRHFYNSTFTFKEIMIDEYTAGQFYVYDIDWGDGSPKEFTSEPKQINPKTMIYHTYETSGIFEVNGTMLRVKQDEYGKPNGILYYEKFIIRINVNEGLDEDFTFLGSDGFSYIPYKNTSPVIGGYSNQSTYYKNIKRQLGFITDEIQTEIKYDDDSDKLKTEIAFNKMDESYIDSLNLLNAFTKERNSEPDGNGDVIYNGIETYSGELGKSVGDVDITNIKYFDTPKNIWEMLGFTSNTGQEQIDEPFIPNLATDFFNPNYFNPILSDITTDESYILFVSGVTNNMQYYPDFGWFGGLTSVDLSLYQTEVDEYIPGLPGTNFIRIKNPSTITFEFSHPNLETLYWYERLDNEGNYSDLKSGSSMTILPDQDIEIIIPTINIIQEEILPSFPAGIPNDKRYWKNIIPQDYSIFLREGLSDYDSENMDNIFPTPTLVDGSDVWATEFADVEVNYESSEDKLTVRVIDGDNQNNQGDGEKLPLRNKFVGILDHITADSGCDGYTSCLYFMDSQRDNLGAWYQFKFTYYGTETNVGGESNNSLGGIGISFGRMIYLKADDWDKETEGPYDGTTITGEPGHAGQLWIYGGDYDGDTGDSDNDYPNHQHPDFWEKANCVVGEECTVWIMWEGDSPDYGAWPSEAGISLYNGQNYDETTWGGFSLIRGDALFMGENDLLPNLDFGLNQEQNWIGTNEYDNNYYYPVLPKYNYSGLITDPPQYPYDNIPFPLEGIITNENYVDENLKLSISYEQEEGNVLTDKSGNQNNGFVFNDYKPKIDNKTFKVNKTKNFKLIKKSKSDGAY